MKPSKAEQLSDLIEDLRNEIEDVEVYRSRAAAEGAVLTSARILALLEDEK